MKLIIEIPEGLKYVEPQHSRIEKGDATLDFVHRSSFVSVTPTLLLSEVRLKLLFSYVGRSSREEICNHATMIYIIKRMFGAFLSLKSLWMLKFACLYASLVFCSKRC